MLNDSRDSTDPPFGSESTTGGDQSSPDQGISTRIHNVRIQTPTAWERADSEALAWLCKAALSGDVADADRRLEALLQDGLSPLDIIDRFIPTAARLYGDAWLSGGHSFAEVTIASARLQGWLRDLEGRNREIDGQWTGFSLDTPEILMVIPLGSQHTLGGMVAMSQFRRLGALVRLAIGQDARAVGRLVRSGSYDMVALSAAGNEGLDFLAKLINSVRSGLGPAPPVVLGGEILNQYHDAAALVGADFGSGDPEEALSLCGLSRQLNDSLSATTPRTSGKGNPVWVSGST